MFQQVKSKIENQESITVEEGVFLYEHVPLHQLGELANSVKENRFGKDMYWVNNRQINYTNICVLSCKFCAFSEIKKDSPIAYDWSLDQIIEKAGVAVQNGARELHIVGGLHPDHDFDYYIEMMGTLSKTFPEITLKAFTAVEIFYFSKISGLTVPEVLAKLKEAGLVAMPGGGAEILVPEIRKKICGAKETGEEWLYVHEEAHKLGIRTNATMLTGHIESFHDRMMHMKYLRDLQDRTNGFFAFIPLVFHPENTNLRHKIKEKTPPEDRLRTIAVSRLFLHNFEHIKAYWVHLGLDVTRNAMQFGASDLDGTIMEERITQAAGSETPQGLTKDMLLQMIKEEGCTPVERNALYEVMG